MDCINGNALKPVGIGSINEEQNKIMEKLEGVYNFLKGIEINNVEALLTINKSLDDLQSSLKYLPTEPSFHILPVKIKRVILSYLCDSNAFLAAAVCHEWKKILESRFKAKKVNVGKHCEECEDDECFKPSEIMKAAAAHRMDVHLSICHPVTEVDSKIVADGLTSVSNFTVTGGCNCEYNESNDGDDSLEENPILSIYQLEDLFEGLEKKEEIMDMVKFERLDMTDLNQERLATCLVKSIKKLTLNEGSHGRATRMLDGQTFVKRLLRDSAGMSLTHLTLCNFEYSDDISLELADALCNIQNVHLLYEFPLKLETTNRLIENILTRVQPATMKALVIEKYMNFRAIIDPEDLKKLFQKMGRLRLRGSFTEDQVDAVKSLPDVHVRGTSTIFSKVLYCLDK